MTVSNLEDAKKTQGLIIKKYRFSQSIIKELKPLFKLNNFHGLLELVEDWTIIASAISMSVIAWNNLNVVFGYLVYFISIVIIGARMRGLADLLHQSTHKILAKNKILNYLLGSFFSGYLVFQSFSVYRFSHIKNHHLNLGDPDKDPDYLGLKKSGLYGDNISFKNVRLYLFKLLDPITTWNYIQYLIKNRIYNSYESPQEKLLRVVYLSILIGVSLYFGWGNLIVIYWLVPLLTTANWIGSFIELCEHYPMMERLPIKTNFKVNIYMSRNRICNPLENFFTGIHWAG
jgi:fatty acid desaturase